MSVIEIPWILKENEIISEKAPNLRWTKDFMKDMFTTNPNHIICPYPLKGDTEALSVTELMQVDPFHQYGVITYMDIDTIYLDLDDEFEYELRNINNKGRLAATSIYALNRSLVDDEYLVKRINTFLVITDGERKIKKYI